MTKSVAPLAPEADVAAEAVEQSIALGGSVPPIIHELPNKTEVRYYPREHKYELRICHTTDEEVCEWMEVPSVTTVLDVLNKPALPWWGMQMGIDGLNTLVRMGLVIFHEGYPYAGWSGELLNREQIEKLLTINKLTTNHVRDKAGDRGQAAHDAFEEWAKNGTMPVPSIYPPDQEGYVRGLERFLTDCSGTSEGHEVTVASFEHGYAGRYDLRLRLDEPQRVVARKTPKTVKYTELPAGKYLCDLKTSKYIYQSHSIQLEAYEGAGIECGFEPTDYRMVIHLMPDGWYEVKKSRARHSDFLDILRVYQSLNALTERDKTG